MRRGKERDRASAGARARRPERVPTRRGGLRRICGITLGRDGSATFASTSKSRVRRFRPPPRGVALHASLTARRSPPARSACRRTAQPPRGSGRAPRHARAGPRPPVRRESERHGSQRNRGRSPRPIRTRTTTHSRPASLASRASRCAPPQLPRLRLPSPPSTSAVLIAPLVPSSWSSCSCPSLPACRRPASGLHLHAWTCPVFVCRSRKGVQREAVDPLPRKPRREAKPGPEAGRRPVDLQGSTPRDQHQEFSTAPERCTCVPGLDTRNNSACPLSFGSNPGGRPRCADSRVPVVCPRSGRKRARCRPASGAHESRTQWRRQRSGRNVARISVENSSGSSQAAKWPPRSASLK